MVEINGWITGGKIRNTKITSLKNVKICIYCIEYVPDYKMLAKEDEMLIKSRQRPHTAFAK